VHAPEASRRDSPLTPRADQPAVEAILQELRREAVADPDHPVGLHPHRERGEDVRPLLDEVPIEIEDLQPRVAAVGDDDASSLGVEDESVQIGELAGPLPGRSSDACNVPSLSNRSMRPRPAV